MNPLIERLHDILNTMDVPHNRRLDYNWLARNLGVRNSSHPLYNDAIALIKQILRGGK